MKAVGLERVGAVHGKKTLGLVEVAVHSNISAGMGEMLVAAFSFCHLYGHKTFKLKILILFLLIYQWYYHIDYKPFKRQV